jgi:hypothetical protein
MHKGIISAFKRLGSISGRISYVNLTGRWCYIVVLNVHTSTEDESNDWKNSFFQ